MTQGSWSVYAHSSKGFISDNNATTKIKREVKADERTKSRMVCERDRKDAK